MSVTQFLKNIPALRYAFTTLLGRGEYKGATKKEVTEYLAALYDCSYLFMLLAWVDLLAVMSMVTKVGEFPDGSALTQARAIRNLPMRMRKLQSSAPMVAQFLASVMTSQPVAGEFTATVNAWTTETEVERG